MKRTIINGLIAGLSTGLLAACGGGNDSSSSHSEMLAATTACYAAWNSTTAYNGGAQVSYNGVNYVANWWTQGNNPSTNNGTTGSGQPWTSQGACGSTPTPTPAPTPTPTPTPAPTPTPTPAPTPTPTPAPTPSCSYQTWASGVNYALGTIVKYTGNGNFYKEVNAGTNGSDGTDPTISTWYWSPTTCSGTPTPTPTPTPAPTPTPTGLNPSLPPGKNFSLSGYTLQLPTGSSGNVDTVSGSQLASGYTSTYFYTDSSDGAMVMMDPRVGWTTSGSQHPRTEMRENAIWATSGTNILSATVAVTKIPNNTAIAQIFQGTGPSKPLCELQFNSGGGVNLLLENTNQGGNTNTYSITSVGVNTKFNYSLQLGGSTITVKVNGVTKTFTMDSSFVGEKFYFKAGNYDQSATSGTPQTTAGTVVKFYALKITHS